MDPIKVFFFGDSICVGQYVAIHQGWVTRTSAGLYDLGRKINREVVVTNASANGRITRQALEAMAYEVLSHGPDIMIVQFGINDCNHWQTDRGLPRVSPAAFAANLHEIIDRGVHFGARKVFLNTNHPIALDREPWSWADQLTFEESNSRFNQIIRQVAQESSHNPTLKDMEKLFLEEAGNDRDRLRKLLLPYPDQVHLSPAGHKLYFQSIYPEIEAAVMELSQAGRELPN